MCAVEVALQIIILVVIIVIVVVHEVFHKAQILIQLVQVIIQSFYFFLQLRYLGAQIGDQIQQSVDHFGFRFCGIESQALSQSLDVCALFRDIHI